MAKQEYQYKSFSANNRRMIHTIDTIIEDYQQQGFMLTVRQLYYQLVARDIIPNTLNEYKRIANMINDAKLAGMLDWDALEDRTREFVRKQRWDNGAHILQAAISSFHKDMWVGQDRRCFVIVEKEALVGVLEPTCRKYDVPLLAARGYPSGTVLREFVEKDISEAMNEGQHVTILHLGDHDPSGIDMTRDIESRLYLFADDYMQANDVGMEIHRIALNMDQIRDQRPPRNPAKSTDSRFKQYRLQHGNDSWELDALSPSYLARLVTRHIEECIDDWDRWNEIQAGIEHTKGRLTEVAQELKS